MTIEAKIIAHSRAWWANSKSEHGGTFDIAPEVITFQLKYPRFIHAELMTHRLFSRNASSSRAIPVARMIQDILDDTAMPSHWGKNQPGMQANEEQNESVVFHAQNPDGASWQTDREGAWLEGRDRAIEVARAFNDAGYHKQIVNRVLEPYMHISVVVTATNFDNFYWLRRHKDAQPEIRILADAMWAEQQASTPTVLAPGDWHLPYVHKVEMTHTWDTLCKLSSARCARVSYLTHDGRKPHYAEDLALFDRLVGGEPMHASPTEHQARCDEPLWGDWGVIWDRPDLSGNFDPGWVQFRKTLPGERCTHYVPMAD